MSVSELKEENKKLASKSLLHTIFFLLGFSAVFIMIGFSTTFIADFLLKNQHLIREVGAVLIVSFGLIIVGVLNFSFLSKSKTFTFKNHPAGILGLLLIGLAFSMCWSPCTATTLLVVVSLAAFHPEQGLVLMTSFVFGCCILVLILSFFFGRLDWIKRHSPMMLKIGGWVMVFF